MSEPDPAPEVPAFLPEVPDFLPPGTEMISQPLLTEEGFVNPACLAELDAALTGLAPDHERLESDPEWIKGCYTTRSSITGAFAQWACRQSPYGVPDGLENVCKYLHACLATVTDWGQHDMAKMSLCDINRWLHEILYEQGVKEFDAWNERRNKREGHSLTSAFGGRRDPDDDFICLSALLRNVCITIRDERRKDKAFDDAFEREHGPPYAEVSDPT